MDQNNGSDLHSALSVLGAEIGGSLSFDETHSGIYATDASNYQIRPLGVVFPRSEEDVFRIVHWARRHRIPLVGRGGGTSLVGQTIGEGLVVDFSRYMDRMLELNVEERWAWVEPGIVRDVLHQALKPYGLHFAPDPATSSRATVGGMIANNSSGTRSLRYGKTLDHVLELRVLLADGSVLHTRDIDLTQRTAIAKENSREGEILRNLTHLVEQQRDEILTRFPKVMRRVGGYNLDELLGETWNLSKLFTGSEGTLGILLAAKIHLEPLPAHQSICVVHFSEFFESISHVEQMVQSGAVAVELLDRMLIEKSRENLETQRYCHFIQGEPVALQVVEFNGETRADAEAQAHALARKLEAKGIGFAWPVYSETSDIEAVFTVRKKGLGLLMGVKGRRKPIPFIEDAAVPLQHLASYIREVYDICHRHGADVVAYAHASVGLLHVKPLLDLRDAEDIERMKAISADCLERVLHYGGSWSGEHGDGLARSPFNECFFGSRLYAAFREVKNLFDPDHVMNPGKIVDAPPQDANLRYGAGYRDQFLDSMYHYRTEGGFSEAAHLCNGVGECRKLSGGTMCPSFRATHSEKDSTRGRANLLRLAISGQLKHNGLHSPELQEIMDLCLACKACKAECPSNVDMAKFKSEVMYASKKSRGIGTTDRLMLAQENINSWLCGPAAPLANALIDSSPFRWALEKLAGLDRRRVLPHYAKRRFAEKSCSEDPDVVFFADSYVRYHEPQTGDAALALLKALGLRVAIIDTVCCQRPLMSRGLLDEARARGHETFKQLLPFLERGTPVVVCEPSCASALRDDLPDLMTDPAFSRYSEQIMPIEDFVASREDWIGRITMEPGEYLMHGHCHQRALFTTTSLQRIFAKQTNVRLLETPGGCCGMAGAFGYEKKHYELSVQIAGESILPGLKGAPESTHLVFNGFSCRHQAQHLTGRLPRHWVELVRPRSDE
ncbi:MAG: FAD-binding protein [Saprospiraceae bacterium]|nr:FAD-binding protein [Saprospiraceae bacterium]